MLSVLGIALGLAVLLTFAIALYGSLEITRIPHYPVPYRPEDFHLAFDAVEFSSHDGLRLRGWFIPADAPSPVTLIIMHGLGSNAGDLLGSTQFLRNGGTWNLYLFSFRGHGESEGNRTSLGPFELLDFEAGLAFLKSKYPEASRRIGVFGHSLGAAVAIEAAARHPELEAVVAESPFSTIARTVRHYAWIFYGIPYYPFMQLAVWITSLRLGRHFGDFNPVEAIGKISPRPIFLIQAERDLRMPLSDAQALWAAAKEPKEWWLVPGADHGEPWLVAQQEFEQRVLNFFRKVLP